MAIGALHARIPCPLCDEWTFLEWIPQIGRISASHGPTFTAFECYDGMNRKVRVESIADLRRIERESEQQARNGEGQIMVWRDYSNDRTNKYDSAISPSWSAPGQPSRESDWHDHPQPLKHVPTRSGDDIKDRTAAEGVENRTIDHLK